MTRLLLLLALAPPLHAAPAPLPRPAGVRPGLYALAWQGAPFDVLLTAGGEYRCRPEGRRNWAWTGSWQWCPDARTLYVQERFEGGDWAFWTARLDGSLSGRAVYGGGKVKVRLGRRHRVGNPLYEVMALLDAAGVGGRSAVEQVEALLADYNRLLAQTQAVAKETDYDRLLASLDQDRCEAFMLLYDCALDEGRLDEARGWGWLWTHRRWPRVWARHNSPWCYYWARGGGHGLDSPGDLPAGLLDLVEPAEYPKAWPTAQAALRAVVGAIAQGRWAEGKAPPPLEGASRRALERFGREVARAARRDAGL